MNTLCVDGEIFKSGKNKLRIQNYPDTCGRGLSYFTLSFCRGGFFFPRVFLRVLRFSSFFLHPIYLLIYRLFALQYPFHADAHKRDTKNLIHVAINTLEAQDHICKRPKEGLPKRASVASLFGDSLAAGPGDVSTRSGKEPRSKYDLIIGFHAFPEMLVLRVG